METHLSSRPLRYWEYAKAGASRATMCSRFKIGWIARASTTRLAGIATSWIYTSKATKPSITDEASRSIPYRILTPKGIKNLLTAGRCISTDEEALGSLRVMPPSLVTGEAAGLAAALAIKQSKNDVHNIDVDFLRKRLREEGQYFK